jgi:hypothetical protein
VGSVRKTPSGSYELTIRNKKLLGARRVYLTFENEQAAKDYGVQVDKLLKAGIVPPGLLDEKADPGERCRSSCRRASTPATPHRPKSTR